MSIIINKYNIYHFQENTDQMFLMQAFICTNNFISSSESY